MAGSKYTVMVAEGIDSRNLAIRVNRWYENHHRDLPWRREGFSAWGQLVAEFMLQQTQVDRVVPRLQLWLERWPTPAALAADSPAEAIRLWDRLGYPRRALWLHQAAVQIVERFGGEVPSDVDALLTLKGVGPYTARAIAAFAYLVRTPVVDTNTRRVIARVIDGRASAGMPNERVDLAQMAALLPEHTDAAHTFNAAMMELGAIVCTARKPLCAECPICEMCAWAAEGYPDNAPSKRPKQATFEGSDRQMRGRILALMRESPVVVTQIDIESLGGDPLQRDRAMLALLDDGLIEQHPDGFHLAGFSV